MKHILVPTDYSTTALNATNYALNLAKQIKAKVTLLHIYNIPVPPTDFPMVVSSIDEIENSNKQQLKKHVDELTTKHPEVLEIKGIVKLGFVFDEIKCVVETEKVDLIIMGITGAGRIAEIIIGSNATRVVQNLNCPAIIIPPGANYKPIKNIVFACDYTESEKYKAIDTLVEYVKMLDAKLMVLNIGNPSEKHTYSKELAGRLLEYIFENASEAPELPNKIDYSMHKRKDEDITHGINRFAEKYNADLIVMIPKKNDFLSNLFNKSNTKKMAFHTHIPVLTLHEE
jgi:nucleotide-binding universal stress UspA family protein